MIVSPLWGPPRMQGLCSNSPLFWAPEKPGLGQPLLNVSPLLGSPENAWVMQQFRPLLGPREGKGEAATFECVPFVGDPRECKGLIAILSSLGPPKRQG